MLQLENLSKSYDGKPVLTALSHTFAQGEVWQIAGNSGKGKTTLLRILLGLERQDSGNYTKPQNYRFGAVFQEDRLLPWCNAVENVRFSCDASVPDEQIRQALTQLGITDFAQPASTLSGGMKRRVALVRALLSDSDCLVLDEPFVGLDGENVALAQALIAQYQQGRLVLFVSHEGQVLGAKVLQL